MSKLKRFSTGGRKDVIERRDCLFDPYAEKRSSYLRKDDLLGFPCDFSVGLSEERKKLEIGEFRF